MKQNSSLSQTHDSRGRYKLSDRRSNVNLQKTIVPKPYNFRGRAKNLSRLTPVWCI